VAAPKRVHLRRTRNNVPPIAKEEDVIDQIKVVEPPVPKPTVERPRRSIAQYQRDRQAKVNATTYLQRTSAVPITQDDESEINCVKSILQALPKLRTMNTPCNIKQHALYHVIGRHLEDQQLPLFTPKPLQATKLPSTAEPAWDHEHYANGVVHPITKETITKYEKLANDPVTKEVWTKAMSKELGRLAQGFDGTKGTETIFFMTKTEIQNIPKDHTVTYARIVVDYHPQKEDPNRVRITVGGNLIDYPGELTTRTADITTAKILLNSTLSTPGAKFACADMGNFYLATPMERYEYMRIKADLIPDEFKDTYKLHNKIHNGYVYCEIRRGMYGLPQAGIIAN
jgi:hypothetical protein